MIRPLLFLICLINSSLMLQAEPFKPVGATDSFMPYTEEKQEKKLVVGLMIKTSNEQCLKDMPELWGKFMQEKIGEKIRHKVNQTLLAVYTNYEGDFTQPYSYLVGYEVSTLKDIPQGLTGVTIPASRYAVFSTEGPFPQGLSNTWQKVWQTPLKRAYTSDFEVYSPDFNPQTNPSVKVYIAL